MSQATPSILNDVEEFQNFSTSVYVEDVGFLTTIPANVTGVSANLSTDGVAISFSGPTVSFSGKYTNIFPEKTFEYLVTESQEEVTVTRYDEIPSNIHVLTQYNPVNTLSRTITYTISTSSGSAIVTQTVRNNWDSGKAQMLAAQSRGTV
jgi:hypothetical protein